jgi:hypothetical protein
LISRVRRAIGIEAAVSIQDLQAGQGTLALPSSVQGTTVTNKYIAKMTGWTLSATTPAWRTGIAARYGPSQSPDRQLHG